MDAIDEIRQFNAGRDPERLALKYRKMRASAFAFLRGSCHLFYQGLPAIGLFKNAPPVWLCGDLHLENFGSYKGDNRLVYFDINDFDEAALGPASWDLARLLTSVWVGLTEADEGAGASPREARILCKSFLDVYAATLSAGKAYWIDREAATGLLRDLLDGLRERPRSLFLDARAESRGKKRWLRLDGKKALPATRQQTDTVKAFMAGYSASQDRPGFYKVLDVARRVAGTGSLGLDRYVILVEGKGSPQGNYLLDLKLAVPSSLSPFLKTSQPRWPSQAHRVVELQRRIQAVPMAFLQPVEMGGQAYVLRGLQPSEDRVTLNRATQSMASLVQVLGAMGKIVAWAHLRSAGRQGSAIVDELIDFGQRKKWRDKLMVVCEDCAASVRADALAFNTAYDDGLLGTKT